MDVGRRHDSGRAAARRPRRPTPPSTSHAVAAEDLADADLGLAQHLLDRPLGDTPAVSEERYDESMAYDEQLADRVRAAVGDRPGITERPMFGGLCLLSGGNMFAGIQGETLMARVGPDRYDEALGRPHARIMDFNGRPMRGFVYVDPEGIRTGDQLREWLELSLEFVDTLPAK